MSEQLLVFTNDDAGSGDVALYYQLLDFLKARGVRGTFFTVPFAKQQRLGERPEWVAALRRALDEGHEVGLHGFDHSGFECGMPPDYMLDLMGESAWQTLRSKRGELRTKWQEGQLTERLARGVEILEQDLGVRPKVFRAPCCTVSPGLYRALANVGIGYDSDLIVNPQGWPYCAKDFDTHLEWDAYPPRPFRYLAGVVELPVISEYTWYLETERHAEKAFELMQCDYDRVASAGGVFLPMSHFYAMTGPYALGLRVYERLLDYAQSRGPVRFCTAGELAGEIERGAITLA